MTTHTLHKEVGVFDAHADLLYTVVREHELGNERVIEDRFLPGMRAGGIDMRVAPIYLDAGQARESATRLGLRMAESFHREIEQTAELESARTAKEVESGAESDEVTLILGMEGAEPLKGDLAVLDTFYRLGLRVLGLTHSRRNMAADGAFFEPIRTGEPGGLSAFGVDAVERCAEQGIVVDVSHLNEPGFWDVIEFAEGPIIASHSNCRELRDHPRNLRDEQLHAIAESGGVVGINALQAFLHGDDPGVETVVDQLEHAVDVAGVDHVGVGFDFYEYNLEYMSPAERAYMINVSAADGLGEDGDVGNLTPALLKRGFDPDDVRKLLKWNLVRVFQQVLD
ncbi:dipeptidase [Halegenticoccus tardaugens]|uniref:dipeptidase n=1 Tax=Halegenticoccus tardaugens TaxID=2071624 RepID=UPI0013E97ABF|nr:dipeptidase [Halegenticoccus tardaugens]